MAAVLSTWDSTSNPAGSEPPRRTILGPTLQKRQKVVVPVQNEPWLRGGASVHFGASAWFRECLEKNLGKKKHIATKYIYAI